MYTYKKLNKKLTNIYKSFFPQTPLSQTSLQPNKIFVVDSVFTKILFKYLQNFSLCKYHLITYLIIDKNIFTSLGQGFNQTKYSSLTGSLEL